MGYPRNSGNKGSSSFSGPRHQGSTFTIDENIKRAFDSGDFAYVRSKIQQYLRNRNQQFEVKNTIKNLYLEVKNHADSRNNRGLKQWDDTELLKNAAIVAAHAVIQDLRTTQIRKIIEMAKNLHTEVTTNKDKEYLQQKIKKEAGRMNMLMAYYAGKNRSVLPLQEILEPILSWLARNPSSKNFEKVYMFFEAIVAYHRYFGGRE